MMHFVRTFSLLRAKGVLLSKRFEIMEKLYRSTRVLKMAGGMMHTPHPIPLDPPLAISYRNHQKSLAYFSHLAQLVLFFFTKRLVKRGRHGTMPRPH